MNTTTIEIQEWEDGFAAFFAEGDHEPEAFCAAVREHGPDYPEEDQPSAEQVVREKVFKLDAAPDGFYAYYTHREQDAEGEPGRYIDATYVRAR